MTPGRTLGWKPVAIGASAAVFVAVLGGLMTDISGWYTALRKPAWQPPDWLFGPAWTVIFALTTMSGLRAWRDARDRRDREWLLALFAVNGFLNVLWSLLFFRLRRADLALVEVVFLWLSILSMMLVFKSYSKAASALLLPYIIWVTFAAFLNLAIVRLNGLL